MTFTTTSLWTPAHDIRGMFSMAMSEMYRQEVPLYGQLLELVNQVNQKTLSQQPDLHNRLQDNNELERLGVERHGAIRLGTAAELSTMRRLFAVLGMEAVGYYDLSVAGVPVHSTAFRPVDKVALNLNPFRVFTSLLRLELVQDLALREKAQDILDQRQIFTKRLLELLEIHQQQGGLSHSQAQEFVKEALETFRWHSQATVDAQTYQALAGTHKLVADVVCFKGPHINHLTPRTLDIDEAQRLMPSHGMDAKDVIEGPPRRVCPILLRQTSFKALQEEVAFSGERGTHMARFGEIEQRGIALTPKGRELYDALLNNVRTLDNAGSADASYAQRLTQAFAAFPDDWDSIRTQGLGYFQYLVTDTGAQLIQRADGDVQDWIRQGWVQAIPVVYEDFLPVSAAGIFQSNLGGQEQKHYRANEDQRAFEKALGSEVHDPFTLYATIERNSLQALRQWAQQELPA